jgi:hypothetical protein
VAEFDDGGLDRAARKRFEALKARRLARSVTDRKFIEAANAYAAKLESEAVLLEQQAAALHKQVETTRRLSGEIQDLADGAQRELEEMQRKLKE